ncbi:DUF6338 family protein [Halomonas sp. McH1-25]|uniref:DUF6338 family protein n=1 Tax=unclassified Halomonas TaxID=2609666 RepID=UPI001EF43AA4|nr:MULTISPECIES: DUF6338 family protein [unclassified Halomonas]MCG7598389.1 DUF6338 family protein [Halomonas sp. McH1-25]MCP1342669.1 DUF6338 family protein [Halomonas sp. FL8]MCP1362563.1 DUF6338 family protein [Halomonas sp. BBD45]MCP1363729.1 DUF6338 family protein [Halomonas sp. BBD48]
MTLDSAGVDFLLKYIIPGLIVMRLWSLQNPYTRQTVNEQVLSAAIFGAICYLITSCFPSHVDLPLYVGSEKEELTGLRIRLSDSPSVFGLLLVPLFVAWLRKLLVRKFFPNKHPSAVAWEYVFGEYLVGKTPVILKITLDDGSIVAGAVTKDATFSEFPDNHQIFLDLEYEVDEKGNPDRPKEGSVGLLLMGNNISHIEFISDKVRYYDE